VPGADDATPAPKLHHFTADVGGGWTGREGANIDRGNNLEGGAGVRLSPQSEQYDDCGYRRDDRRWSLYVNADFLFNWAGLSSIGVSNAVTLNPQDPTLLSAINGRAKFYSTTLDPTFRYRFGGWFTVYATGGFGWMRRSVEFTGLPVQGTVIQGPVAVITGFGGNSGVFDAGGGVSFGPIGKTGGVTYYVEARWLQGIGLNSGIKLAPVSFGLRW
jgi:opacity protein-like surface antigen